MLSTIGLSIGAVIFVLGVMIFVHEFGHFLMAKLLGIRVDVFSIGFGPRLLGFKRGDTDYRVSALPLGGYVKMAGENYEDELTGEPDEFLSRPKRHRFAVAIAGPLMNFALAIFLVWVGFLVGIEVPTFLTQPPVIGKVEAGSPAAQAGLKPRDRILSIGGEKTPTWRDFELAIAQVPNQPTTITVMRGDQVIKDPITPVVRKGNPDMGTIGVDPYIPYVIHSVERGSPASKAGLKSGDEILKVSNGKQTADSYYDIPKLIEGAKGDPLLFQIQRGDRTFEKTIAPTLMDGHVRIGIEIRLSKMEQYGPASALTKSVQHNYKLTALTFDVLGRIVTGRTSMRAMTGPIGIAKYSGIAASQGIMSLMAFMALISLNLAIFNILPIPILDGGVMALLIIEGITGREMSVKVKERILQIGFIFLILLMGIVIFNDIAKNF